MLIYSSLNLFQTSSPSGFFPRFIEINLAPSYTQCFLMLLGNFEDYHVLAPG